MGRLRLPRAVLSILSYAGRDELDANLTPANEASRMSNLHIARGRPLPLGATRTAEGVNFALHCRHGTAVTLVITPLAQDHPLTELVLDPRSHRTGDHWHLLVQGLPDSFRFGWRVNGPTGTRHRYDPKLILLDPAATMLSDGADWGATCESDPLRTGRRSVFHRLTRYDWQDDAPPLRQMEDSIIYELHVRGFTWHPSAGVSAPGTFRGLIEKIPYLKWLGVTAVELLPIHEFDECDCPFTNPKTGEPLQNFWGYNSIAFAAPKAAYAASGHEYGQLHEFRDLVRALHQAGIEIILDVVFNHTGEGNEQGRTYSFRGLDNELYYMLGPNGEYLNFSGCGNTMNCNHPVVRELLMTCLRYWVGDMHVDGFRFDLASILGRSATGEVLVEPPTIETIAEDGVLADTKLIAEPWDAGGLYQVGHFPFGRRWSEWNGRYRDDVRRFWRGDAGCAGALASRICGSADLYQWNGRLPRHSINFITCHDGFTLADLVSYNHKHNEANGENNLDGSNDNHSWNCGIEGPSTKPQVLELRQRQAKNLIATLLLSQGVPMLLAGDEFLRTQQGNNNAWCQDNELSWVDWRFAEENADFLRFVREMIQLRKRHPVFRRRRFFQGKIKQTLDGGSRPAVGPEAFPAAGPVRPQEAGVPKIAGKYFSSHAWPEPPLPDHPADIIWHGPQPGKPDFGYFSKILAFSLDGRYTGRELELDFVPDRDFYVAMNAWRESIAFRIPYAPTRRPWRRIVDTALHSPRDIVAEADAPPITEGQQYLVAPHSLIILMSVE